MNKWLTSLLMTGLLCVVQGVSAQPEYEPGCQRGDCITGYGVLVEETDRGLTLYRGEFREGQYHGDGRLEYLEAGEIYDGDFFMGSKQGRGILSSRSTGWSSINKVFDVYIGEWRNDRRNGQGTQAFNVEDWDRTPHTETWLINNTENYSGAFVNDVFNGQGTYRWADGTKYTGGWAANKKHGRGYFDFGTGIRSERIFEFDVQVDF